MIMLVGGEIGFDAKLSSSSSSSFRLLVPLASPALLP